MSEKAIPQSTEENPAGHPAYDPQTSTEASTLGEVPAYESQLNNAPAYAHTTYQASARPQLHGRTKSEEAAYLESLREWVKEKETARPGDGTLSATPAGYGPPPRDGGSGGTGVVMGVQEQQDANSNDWLKYIPRETEEAVSYTHLTLPTIYSV